MTFKMVEGKLILSYNEKNLAFDNEEDMKEIIPKITHPGVYNNIEIEFENEETEEIKFIKYFISEARKIVDKEENEAK